MSKHHVPRISILVPVKLKVNAGSCQYTLIDILGIPGLCLAQFDVFTEEPEEQDVVDEQIYMYDTGFKHKAYMEYGFSLTKVKY